ncbi:MAG: carbohydrate ABC transporter permease, partial [Burkholderiales bacterium]
MIARLRNMSERQIGSLIALIFVAYNLVFWLYPVIWLGILSASDWRFFGSPTISGIGNFHFVLTDHEFWNSLWNVLHFMIYYIPITLASSLAFAFGLRHVGYGKMFVALCFLLANISSGVAYSLVFTKIFSSTGPLNSFLQETFGVTIPWLTNPSMALFSISLVVAWKFVGYYGLILYS